jgi:hypothetical protein
VNELAQLRRLLFLRIQDVSSVTAISMSKLSIFEKTGQGLSRPELLGLREFLIRKALQAPEDLQEWSERE